MFLKQGQVFSIHPHFLLIPLLWANLYHQQAAHESGVSFRLWFGSVFCGLRAMKLVVGAMQTHPVMGWLQRNWGYIVGRTHSHPQSLLTAVLSPLKAGRNSNWAKKKKYLWQQFQMYGLSYMLNSGYPCGGIHSSTSCVCMYVCMSVYMILLRKFIVDLHVTI